MSLQILEGNFNELREESLFPTVRGSWTVGADPVYYAGPGPHVDLLAGEVEPTAWSAPAGPAFRGPPQLSFCPRVYPITQGFT